MPEGLQNRIPQTPPEEREAIAAQQAIEREWWQGVGAVETLYDLDLLVQRGEAVPVTDAAWYRISARAPQELNYLRPQAQALLETISREWAERCGENSAQFLVITSLARTTAHQAALIKAGYPGVTESTHTKLAAFDIAYRWFLENDEDSYQALISVLGVYQEAGTLNFIMEPSVGVIHVCVSPTYTGA